MPEGWPTVAGFTDTSRPVLIELKNEDIVVGSPEQTIIEDLSLTIREGERWAILGPNGSGKSVTAAHLLQTLQKQEQEEASASSSSSSSSSVPARPSGVCISFDEQRRLLLREQKDFKDGRFEANNKRATVASYLFPELYPADPQYPNGYTGYRPPRTRLSALPVPYDADETHPLFADYEEAVHSGETAFLLREFNLMAIRHQPIYGLSTGQLRKLMLADGLLNPPKLLILDEALDGLDRHSRKIVADILDEHLQSALVMIAHREQDLAPEPSHVLIYGQGQRPGEYSSGLWKDKKVHHLAQMALNAEDEQDVEELPPLPSSAPRAKIQPVANSQAEPLVEFRDVRIQYAERVILNGLNWTVRQGENWVIAGGNGSGKSTMLQLITGDNPLSYTQDISLFGRKKGTGESIWDIKRQLGVVSTEFHCEYADFADPSNQWYARSHSKVTTWQVVCSGFFDSIGLYEDVGASHRDQAIAWIKRFNLQDLVPIPSNKAGSKKNKEDETRDFGQLSFGQQKLVLLCRAMVKQPRLLLLDEPSHGLSGLNRARLLQMLRILADDTSVGVVLVTHRQDELEELAFEHLLQL